MDGTDKMEERKLNDSSGSRDQSNDEQPSGSTEAGNRDKKTADCGSDDEGRSSPDSEVSDGDGAEEGEESEYSYEDEDGIGCCFVRPAVIGPRADGRVAALLHSEIADVAERYGPGRAMFREATAVESVRHGPRFTGFVRLRFPPEGGPLERKRDLARMWGFDPRQPIVVRFCHFLATDDEPVRSRRDLFVAAYQGGDEPPCTAVVTEKREGGGSDDDSSWQTCDSGEGVEAASWGGGDSPRKSTKRKSWAGTPQFRRNILGERVVVDTESESRADEAAPKVDVIESICNIPFRMGDQIKRITEEFLMKGLKGVEGSAGEMLVLSVDSLRKRCDVCTYLNIATALRCEICEGTVLTQVNGEGLLPRLYAHLFHKIQHLHRFCVNCGECHLGGSVQPTYPTVCQRELCQWALAEYGIGRAKTDDIAIHAEEVDLLIAITHAAANSPRTLQILDPFPLVFVKSDKGEKEKALDPNNPDYNMVGEVTKLLPSMQQMTRMNDESQLQEICNKASNMAYGLLQWIITSCPARIVSLQGNHRLRSMGTEYQFLISSASPDQEEAFSQARREYGSTFAFHGSSIENWHSILRNGILNCSGTHLQVHGASYGNGVYLSPQASMGLGYSNVILQGLAKGGAVGARLPANRFVSDKDIRVMALCEVIDIPFHRRSTTIWVVPNAKDVIPRFLFVFVPSSPGFAGAFELAAKCDTNDSAFLSEVRTLCCQILDDGMY